MTKTTKLGRGHLTIGFSRNSFGLAILVSKYGIDLTFMFWWLSIER